MKIKKLILPVFACGFVSAIISGLFFIQCIFFIPAIAVLVLCSLFLFIYRKESRKYSYILLITGFFSFGYSFFYTSLIGGFFSNWEAIHAYGSAGLLGYGVLLFINSSEYNNRSNDEQILLKMIRIAVAAGISAGGFGIWWMIIITGYYMRFFYWPVFWIITSLCSVCCCGIGIFSILLANNVKKILPIIMSDTNNTLFPVFRYILGQRVPGIFCVSLSLLCIIYQTGLFPVFGF